MTLVRFHLPAAFFTMMVALAMGGQSPRTLMHVIQYDVCCRSVQCPSYQWRSLFLGCKDRSKKIRPSGLLGKFAYIINTAVSFTTLLKITGWFNLLGEFLSSSFNQFSLCLPLFHCRPSCCDYWNRVCPQQTLFGL